MTRQPEISSAYARLILQSGVAGRSQLLQGVTLSEQDIQTQEFIGVDDLAQLFRNYDKLINDPTWPALLGAQLNVASHGPLGFAALSAPTLGDAMDVIGEFQAARNSILLTRTLATTSDYRLELEGMLDDTTLNDWLALVVLKVVETLLASILGHPVGRNVSVSLAQPAPPCADDLARCFDATLRFSQVRAGIAVPLAWRQLPSPLYDEEAYRINLIKCRELIAEREQANSVAHSVRNRLANHFDAQSLAGRAPAPPPTLEALASDMHTTPRTLIRRLEREGQSFRELLEEIRRAYAQQLLQDAGLTVADVGEALGYREAANFGRAFKRWYGMSPGAWRRRRQQ